MSRSVTVTTKMTVMEWGQVLIQLSSIPKKDASTLSLMNAIWSGIEKPLDTPTGPPVD